VDPVAGIVGLLVAATGLALAWTGFNERRIAASLAVLAATAALVILISKA
jgi:hypothetical protein